MLKMLEFHAGMSFPIQEQGPEVTISQVTSQEARSFKERSREPVGEHPQR
jgi:hypothetical protein